MAAKASRRDIYKKSVSASDILSDVHAINISQSNTTALIPHCLPVVTPLRFVKPDAKTTIKTKNIPNCENDTRRLMQLIDRDITSVNDMRELTSYVNLNSVYRWVTNYRAGFLLIYQDINAPSCPVSEVLLVKQKSAMFYRQQTKEVVDIQFTGPPKGSAELEDGSAFNTAVRELHEETGIDILDPCIGAKILPDISIIKRCSTNVSELHIYFLAVVTSKPKVVPCAEELEGYEWVNIISGLRKKRKTASITTQILYDHLEKLDFKTEVLNWLN